MSVSAAQPPVSKKLVSIAAAQATGASANFTIPFADSYTFYFNVTSAGQTTCDVVFQTSVDGGTTYVNVPWRFAQVTTTTGCFCLDVHAGVGAGTDINANAAGPNGTLIGSTGGVLALQAIVIPAFMKLGYTVTGTAPIADLYVMAWPRGSRETIE